MNDREALEERPLPEWAKTCTCPRRYVETMGVLYGVKMMGGWVRVRGAEDCPEHGGDSPA